jgi:hypothetical protein
MAWKSLAIEQFPAETICICGMPRDFVVGINNHIDLELGIRRNGVNTVVSSFSVRYRIVDRAKDNVGLNFSSKE